MEVRTWSFEPFYRKVNIIMTDGGETETVKKFLLLEKLKEKKTSVKRRVTQTIKEIDEAIQCNKRKSLELWVSNSESLDKDQSLSLCKTIKKST